MTSLTATDYATGDISSTGIYYGYNAGASITKIDLNPASANCLTATYLPTTVSAINDWAFSPIDNNIYAMATGPVVIPI